MTSDSGSHFLFSQENVPIVNMSQSSETPGPTFANIAENLPKRDAGILINYVEGTQIQEYIRAVGSIVGPRNIKHASRISMHRVCIYLSSKELAENFADKHESIKIKNTDTMVRRLVAPAQRVVISNIWPETPNHAVENFLRQIGIKTLSPITHIKYFDIEEEYAHVCTFKRQVFISAEEARFLPESTTIVSPYDNKKNFIFFSTDVTCYACKEKGHIAKKCPNKTRGLQNSNIPQAEMSIPTETTPAPHQEPRIQQIESQVPTQQSEPQQIESQVSTQQSEPQQTQITDEQGFTVIERKRKGSPRSSSSLDDVEPIIIEEILEKEKETVVDVPQKEEIKNKDKLKSKKKRSESPEGAVSIHDMLQPVQETILMYPNKYILSFEELTEFLELAYGTGEYLKSAEKFTKNISGLLLALQDIRKHICGSSKNKMTRVINRLNEQLNEKLEQDSIQSSPSASQQ